MSESPELLPSNELTRCENCPHTQLLVGSKGPLDSPFVIVGESPGMNEVREKIPFVGPSGQILKGGLDQHPDLIPYVTNAMICFPGLTKTKTPEKLIKAAQCCNARLLEEIGRYPRKCILALGNAALWSLTGNYDLKITQVRGKVFASPYAEKGVVASVHPSYLMRGGGSLRQFLADVDYACSLTKGNDFRKYTIPKFNVLNSVDEIQQVQLKFMQLPQGTPVASDTETGGYNGFDYLRDHILCSGFCHEPSTVWVIPEHLTAHAHHLFLPHLRYIWHNGKFDAKFFHSAGVQASIDDDTMLLSYALDETKGIHDLESVGSDIIGVPDWKYMIKPYLEAAKKNKEFSPELTLNKKGEWVRQTVTYDSIPRPILYDYMSRDISTTLQIFPMLRRNVARDPKLELLYTRMLMPASTYLTKVEMTGLKLDLTRVEENATRLKEKVAEHANEINEISVQNGYVPINPNSWQQLVVLLYDVLKIPTKVRATDIKTIENLPRVPVVVALMKYKKVQKAHSTYVKPAPGWINVDGRVHTTYKIHGTATGRLASEDPNLLNIPRDPLLRGMFVAEDGNIYLEVDANQAELRVLAELSGDNELTRIYTTQGMSLHDEVTVYLYGKISELTEQEKHRLIEKFNCQNFPEKLYDEEKMRAKNVNFGIVYGITPFGLAEQIDDTPAEARKLLDAWMKKFEGAARFIRLCREAPAKNKTLVTPFGRKRRFGVVSPERLMDIQNQAANFPEQSIASDIVLDTGFQMEPIAHKLGVKIVNTIYDSILYECPNDRDLVEHLAKETITTLAQTAVNWGFTKIPMLGEAKVGHRWGNLKDLKKFYSDVDATPN